jgi:hypothetical protein
MASAPSGHRSRRKTALSTPEKVGLAVGLVIITGLALGLGLGLGLKPPKVTDVAPDVPPFVPPRPPNPGNGFGCCWEYECDPSTGPVDVRHKPGYTYVHCQTLPGTRAFVPDADGGKCTAEPPTGTLQCPSPSPSAGSSGSSGFSGGSSGGSSGLAYDGVDLMVRLTTAVRRAFDDYKVPFLLSHAPQTPYLTISPAFGVRLTAPSCYGSYLAIMAQVGTLIDFLNIQAYNNAAEQDCPPGAVIVNNLISGSPSPAKLGPVYGNLPSPTLPPSKTMYGLQVTNPPPPNGISPPTPGTVSPAVLPWCSGNGNLSPKVGNMFWLNANGGSVYADAVVDLWYPPPQEAVSSGPLSPPNRVVYYLNGPGSPYLLRGTRGATRSF